MNLETVKDLVKRFKSNVDLSKSTTNYCTPAKEGVNCNSRVDWRICSRWRKTPNRTRRRIRLKGAHRHLGEVHEVLVEVEEEEVAQVPQAFKLEEVVADMAPPAGPQEEADLRKEVRVQMEEAKGEAEVVGEGEEILQGALDPPTDLPLIMSIQMILTQR